MPSEDGAGCGSGSGSVYGAGGLDWTDCRGSWGGAAELAPEGVVSLQVRWRHGRKGMHPQTSVRLSLTPSEHDGCTYVLTVTSAAPHVWLPIEHPIGFPLHRYAYAYASIQHRRVSCPDFLIKCREPVLRVIHAGEIYPYSQFQPYSGKIVTHYRFLVPWF